MTKTTKNVNYIALLYLIDIDGKNDLNWRPLPRLVVRMEGENGR